MGRGKTIVGGHPNSGRVWQVKGTHWVLVTDGFEYSRRGLVVDSVSLCDDCEPGLEVPYSRLEAKDFAWLGEISLGMTGTRVNAILKRRGLKPKQTESGIEIEAKGFYTLVSDGSFQRWTVRCGFANGTLNTLRTDAR